MQVGTGRVEFGGRILMNTPAEVPATPGLPPSSILLSRADVRLDAGCNEGPAHREKDRLARCDELPRGSHYAPTLGRVPGRI
jgi:hypothetical protein